MTDLQAFGQDIRAHLKVQKFDHKINLAAQYLANRTPPGLVEVDLPVARPGLQASAVRSQVSLLHFRIFLAILPLL